MGSQEAFGFKNSLSYMSGAKTCGLDSARTRYQRPFAMLLLENGKRMKSEEDGGEPKPKRFKIDGEVPDEPEKWFGEDCGFDASLS